ncbi:MAG: class I SAM-dependent methyltransferase [Ktedonobacteraceae bacterium]|nr:class I SAM-dependent methyltransferase [Ktedonobacteraceae bacterium]MBV9709398.1 class I SAM-dependent methyltransferase [Ktedonobacteraceae bacterium]
MDKPLHKISLTQEKETLLMTLWAKAFDNRSKHSILHDTKAEEIAAQIEYDFAKLDSFNHGNLTVLRARHLDEWLRTFLITYPEAVIVQLGCGLDTRVTRIHPPAEVSWFDVDYPEVIALREQFYANHEGYTMIASSVTASQWLASIPKNRPVMIIAEGVLEYLTEEDVHTLFTRLIEAFPHGQIAFDVINSFALEVGKAELRKTGAECKWVVDTVNTIDQWNPRLKRIADQPLLCTPYRRELPWSFRIFYATVALFPSVRQTMRLLLYQF